MPSLHRISRSLMLLACLLALAGCGGAKRGDGGPTRVQPERPAKGEGMIIATLGDSIVAGSPAWDPDPDVRDTLVEADRDSQWQRWVRSDAELRNCGVWGERTDEIATRFSRCTDGAEGVVIQGGINDIVQGRDVADAARDLACIAERARGAGLRVALVEVLPWNNGDATSARAIDQLNARIHAVAERGGVPVLPFHAVLEDRDQPSRMPQNRTVEGDHPNVAGYRELGRRAWREPETPNGAFASDCPEP
ncbi:MAG: GDSL-like Lipase/Acylhydrolase [Thermoleophilia bacterium]|nr:GDSL-like Lipase/Acylhydrolase [Thermoleophilia bacterium]